MSIITLKKKLEILEKADAVIIDGIVTSDIKHFNQIIEPEDSRYSFKKISLKSKTS